MSSLYELLVGSRPLFYVGLAVVFTGAAFYLYQSLFTVRYPPELPRLGAKEGISWREMKQKFMTDCTAVFEDAYENFSKKGRAVIIPVFGPNDEVILPPTSLHWLCKQPDSVVSSLDAQVDAIGLDYTLGHKFAYDPWGGMLIKTDLNSALEIVCAVMNEEVGAAVESIFGNDTENWKEIDLFPACRMVAGRPTLRFTLGDSPEGQRLCKDEAFVNSCYGVLDGMLDAAGAMAAVRRVFRPIYGRWASRIMPPKINDMKTRLHPLFKERMEILQQQATDKNMKVPQDVLQMMLQYAAKERPDEACNLDDMTRRLAVSNFGTMHQTIITLHNIFLNVLDSDKEFNTISVLREEVAKVLGDGTDTSSMKWTRAKVSSMTRADSVARETLRAHSFIGRTVQRLVIAPEGVVTEDGIRLPRGTMVSILAHQSQTDSDTFKDPFKYDPFRFSRPREAAADAATGRPGLTNLSFVSTSSDYLAFSHGKHACPGRFLVDFELKMILAYAVMNYDLEFPESYESKRPPNTWFSGFGIPPLDAKIRVRRRRA
ncbi:cytochrome P450 [Thozetella sp. PMI_491]|nr:cytochrome P450 [Thozetella sp. PMI_491]